MEIPTADRRSYLKAIAVLGGSGLGLGAYSLAASDDAQAATLSFDVVDLSKTLGPDQRVEDITVTAALDYTFDVSHDLDEARYRLSAANGTGTYDTVTEQVVGSPPRTDSGTVTLTGSLLSLDGFTASNFDVATGSTIAIDVSVLAELELWRNNKQVGIADAEAAGRIVVSKEELTVSADLGGTGQFNATVGTETPSG